MTFKNAMLSSICVKNSQLKVTNAIISIARLDHFDRSL
ncbi:hypothetical protein OHAE_4532 [Ochrobactrum soli]|uniref:Uncharacterized protein n=1 Tax=Ochrobactrum soli TaxID=2448455 RepID=A0A2P9HD22_9HYPH|nr:hypothetical protein OHAE_4532 [[Ochrobactrum] soli]